MPAPVRHLFAALFVAVALSATGCGDSAESSKPNPALGEPSKEGPPKRSTPGAAGVKK